MRVTPPHPPNHTPSSPEGMSDKCAHIAFSLGLIRSDGEWER